VCVKDPEDLPFKKGDVLTILQHDEEKWWTARNSEGRTGLVPEPYLERVCGCGCVMESY
jgi:proto-oncogene C-crk